MKPFLPQLLAVFSLATTAAARDSFELKQGWKFFYEGKAQVLKPDADDSAWEQIILPHTWNESDGADGYGYRRGAGWYHLNFKAPERKVEGRFYLEFDGADLVATAWLNGHELGAHYGGFSRFRFDVTDAIKPGADNFLSVKVDNSWRDDTPPLEGDFTMFGGLYRMVRLIQTSDLSVDMMDHGGPGVYCTSTQQADSASLQAKVRIFNAAAVTRQAEVIVSVLDKEGKALASQKLSQQANAAGVSVAELQLKIEKPRLWDGLKDPYLYTVRSEIFENGQLKDSLDQPFGFRSFHVDSEKGFFLNGRSYPLHGVNLHQDRAGSGWAEDAQGLKEDFRILKDLGASFVRVVHYQSHPGLYDLCDSQGYVCWAEQALVNKTGKGELFTKRALEQMTELIRQNFNRPSIAFWSISNEMQTQQPPEAKELLKKLAALCKQEDPSRLSTLATNYEEVGSSYGEDVTAHNKYFGWYGGEFSEFPAWMDKQRAKSPQVPMGISEYGAGAGVSIHYDKPAMMDHSEEYQCLYHEAAWKAIAARPWLFETSVWCLFDFASDGRAEGESLGINDKGLVTRDRKVKKDAFYFYKAQWSQEPFVHINSRRFVARTLAKTSVKVYSNQAEVELFHNGQSLGKKKPVDGVALWEDVELKPWANKMEAKAGQVEDSCVWILNVYYNPWANPKK